MVTLLRGQIGQHVQPLVVLVHVQDIVIVPILHQCSVAVIVLDRYIK
jgi:hypothetical protein